MVIYCECISIIVIYRDCIIEIHCDCMIVIHIDCMIVIYYQLVVFLATTATVCTNSAKIVVKS